MLAKSARQDIERRANLMLTMGTIAVARDRHSPKWCREKLVGPLKTFLGAPPLPDSVARLPTTTDLAREEARRQIDLLCSICGRCALTGH